MSKRFIDTGLFDDPWFMDLSNKAKLFWILLITKCDHAGIIKANDKLFKFYLSTNCLETVYKELSNRLIEIKDHYLFIPKFIQFQYPKGLQDNVKAQKSAKLILIDYGLWDEENQTVREQLGNSYLTAQDKNKGKNKNKKKVVTGFDVFYSLYPKHREKKAAVDEWKKLNPDADLQSTILNAVRLQVAYKKRMDSKGEFCPEFKDPNRWLAKECWTDEVPESKFKKPTGFSITVRFSDDRPPEQFNIKDDAQLAETIERMHLKPFSDVEREYLLDVEEFERRKGEL